LRYGKLDALLALPQLLSSYKATGLSGSIEQGVQTQFDWLAL
jgi:hypothetical protein